MAIFRQGVKIGPFDIRAGISRGDLASSAYHKTLQDVRLKQHANTENSIGRFRAMMGRAEGYARQARYAVQINLPTILIKKIDWKINDKLKVDVIKHGIDYSINIVKEKK